MSTFIQRIGTAVPKYAISQREVLNFMLKAHQLNGKEADRLKVLYRATGIHKRHSVIPDYDNNGAHEFYPPTKNLEPFPDTKMRHNKYREEALSLSLSASRNCLGDMEPESITHLISVSCTGMYAPGLDIELVHHLGLRHDVKRTAINFMGCYAAFNAIKVGDAFCSKDEPVNVLIVSTELCTLHFQKEPTEDNLLANALFGDGSAAVLLTNRPASGKTLKLEQSYATLDPSGNDEMAWHIGNHGFEMRLSSYVPDFLEKSIDKLLAEINGKNNFLDYGHYALHPGGRRILQVLENALGITAEQNRHARDILREYGNMSSATILYVLKSIMESIDRDGSDKKVLALAFGPGLTLESMVFSTGDE